MKTKTFVTCILCLIFATAVLSFVPIRQTQDVKKLKFEFTLPQTELIYNALGKLPAEQVEEVRAYILIEYRKQTVDTTKNKPAIKN